MDFEGNVTVSKHKLIILRIINSPKTMKLSSIYIGICRMRVAQMNQKYLRLILAGGI